MTREEQDKTEEVLKDLEEIRTYIASGEDLSRGDLIYKLHQVSDKVKNE